MSWSVVEGDCIDAMRAMDECSVDAVVCDPPYGLEFMGKGWDGADGFRRSLNQLDAGRENAFGRASRTSPEYRAGRLFQEWCEAWATEALRVLKPGGHLLAFGGTRTYHRLACAIEDAGLEIRDCIAWLYGSGFPKSLDVSKAIDAQAGAEREVVGRYQPPNGKTWNLRNDAAKRNQNAYGEDVPRSERLDITAPATPDAERWQGWGTALKPAHEPIVVARKPLTGTVAATVLAHGTGALNVDGCRVGSGEQWAGDDRPYAGANGFGPGDEDGWRGNWTKRSESHASGRWPANVVLDPEAAAMLDEQTGDLPTPASYVRGNGNERRDGRAYGGGSGVPRIDTVNGYGDAGGASRFFYCAKASSAERNAGLDGFEAAITDDGRNVPIDNLYLRGETTRRNVHPTVKPIDLMRWLVRLVTPPGGLVLDPFCGSGTTGVAATLEGFRFLGIEREAEYAAIARARIGWWARQGAGGSTEAALTSGAYRDLMEATGQGDLFGP